MMKTVLKVDLYDDRIKLKAMKAVSGISGVESMCVDMKDQKLTLMGDIDPAHVVVKLTKLCHAHIVSVGPAKEEKKMEESENSVGPVKEEKKKEESENSDDKKKDSTKVPEAEPIKLYDQTRPPLQCRSTNQYQSHCVTGVDEDPNNCVICKMLKSQRFE